MSAKIQRYEIEAYGDASLIVQEFDAGKWVEYDDHLARVQELEREVERLKAEIQGRDEEADESAEYRQKESSKWDKAMDDLEAERDSLKDQVAALSFSLEGFILNAHWIPQIGNKMAEEARKIINAAKGSQ